MVIYTVDFEGREDTEFYKTYEGALRSISLKVLEQQTELDIDNNQRARFALKKNPLMSSPDYAWIGWINVRD